MNSQTFYKVEEYLKIISDLFRLPIFYVKKNHHVNLEILSTFKKNPLFNTKAEMIDELLVHHQMSHNKIPVILSSRYFENYLLIPVCEDDVILIGPVLFSTVSLSRVKKLQNDLQVMINSSLLQNYYDTLTVIDKEKFKQVGVLIYFTYTQKKLKPNSIVSYQELHTETVYEKELSTVIAEYRERLFTHIDPLYEQELLQCIKEGRVLVLKNLLTQFPDGDDLDFLSKSSYLRSIKNIAIASITLATRSAVSGGVFYEKAFSLSDVYIQRLEEQHDSRMVLALMKKVYIEFAQMVANGKRESFSKPITMCKEYIFNHMHEEVSVKIIADVLGLHPNYLSSLFKRETMKPLGEYILEQKIEEAKNLIRFTHNSFSEIAALLCFHDQSHFSKVFKKYTKMTPSAFKKTQE